MFAVQELRVLPGRAEHEGGNRDLEQGIAVPLLGAFPREGEAGLLRRKGKGNGGGRLLFP